ncbi:protein kinase domain-containing protein [Bacillus sp. FJAT-45037]|uniref:protein kinase domain-containing protein n=1 Tax=Bacillus sp. FJAT-45037 TaxID=2011007 RepID=UPI0018E23355|nr:protein kinase family protein [Bacillus sp. FJAT-45037]
MKNSYSESPAYKLAIGTRIVGKWHQERYKVVRSLGAGATGKVYLAESVNGFVALKVGVDNMAITSEVNVLKHFSKVQGQTLGPSLLDVDDAVIGGVTLPFYAMEYLDGVELLSFLEKKGFVWFGILMIQLLGDLEKLHQAGWAFGDLKPDNLLVVGPPARIRWLDVGGTTLLGRSIKEYTEFYDRGYWGCGTRVAEPSYDLFSVAMIMINCAYPKRFDRKGEKPILQLKEMVEQKQYLGPYKQIILKALQGKYKEAAEMRKELVQAVSNASSYEVKEMKPSRSSRQSPSREKKKYKQKKTSYFVEFFLLGSFILLAYILYLFGQMM